MLTKFISLIFMSGRYLNKTNEKKRKFWDSQQKKKKNTFSCQQKKERNKRLEFPVYPEP